MPLIRLDRIHTDGGQPDPAGVKFGQMALKTPQLGVAKRSPKSAIENQRDRLGSRLSPEQIAEADGISILIQ